jgi:hypothetical protein
MGNLITYFLKKKNKNNKYESVPLVDFTHEIDELNEKFDDNYKFLENEIVPVINELKSRLYNIEVKNNFLNRELASIKYKLNDEEEDEFCSIFDDQESRSDVESRLLILDQNNNSIIDSPPLIDIEN